MRIKLLLLVILGTASSTPGRAADIFVHNELGSDAFSGRVATPMGGLNGPVRTINAALRRANKGGTIQIIPTRIPYREEVQIDGSHIHGYADAPLVIEGNGVELLGVAPVDPFLWSYVKQGTYRFLQHDAAYGLVWLGNKPAPRDLGFSAGDVLDPETGALSDGFYYFNVPAGRQLREYPLGVTHLKTGILVHRASHVVIRNLRIHGFQLDGVQVRGRAEGVRVQNCEILGNGRTGVSGYTRSEVELENCFLMQNGQSAVLGANHSTLYLKSCALGDSPLESIVDEFSAIRKSGGAPEPLNFGAPIPTRLPAQPAPAVEPETPQPVPPKRSFFE